MLVRNFLAIHLRFGDISLNTKNINPMVALKLRGSAKSFEFILYCRCTDHECLYKIFKAIYPMVIEIFRSGLRGWTWWPSWQYYRYLPNSSLCMETAKNLSAHHVWWKLLTSVCARHSLLLFLGLWHSHYMFQPGMPYILISRTGWAPLDCHH